jgi:Tfp pilus assembly protein PilF
MAAPRVSWPQTFSLTIIFTPLASNDSDVYLKMKDLETKISVYQKELDRLPLNQTTNYESHLRRILIVRDDIARLLETGSHANEATFGRIVELDKRLKGNARTIVGILGEDTLINLREATQKPVTAWWWFLDKRAAEDIARDNEVEQKRNALWVILTALCVTISLSLIAEILKRFFSGGRDWLGVVSTIIQAPLLLIHAVLGLLAMGTLTDPGRQWIEKLLTQIGLFTKYGAIKRLIIAAVVLILVVGFRLSLPSIARSYVRRGTRYIVQNNQSRAMDDYQRAISLDPDDARAHYGLGTVYETMHNYDEAINEYRSAVTLDNKLLEAHNNLARLYIWRGKDKDFENALQILNDAINLSPQEQDIRYVLFKNRGWANYEFKHYPQAEDDLRQAIQIDQNRPGRKDDSNDRAAPHCLLGYVLEAQNKEGAKEEWEDCLSYSAGEEDLKADWVITAKSRLRDAGGQ